MKDPVFVHRLGTYEMEGQEAHHAVKWALEVRHIPYISYHQAQFIRLLGWIPTYCKNFIYMVVHRTIRDTNRLFIDAGFCSMVQQRTSMRPCYS